MADALCALDRLSEGDEPHGDGLAGGVDAEGEAEPGHFFPRGGGAEGGGGFGGRVAVLPFEGEGLPGDEQRLAGDGVEAGVPARRYPPAGGIPLPAVLARRRQRHDEVGVGRRADLVGG